MHVLNINGIFSTTYYTYDRCLEAGGKCGPDAWALYTFYCKQSHIQNNQQSFTLNKFVREGLGWGDKRVKNARAVLKELGLIDDIVVRDEKGVIVSHYVRVNYSIDEKDVRTAGMTYSLSTTASDHDVVTGRCGGMDTNTLNITNKYPELNKNTKGSGIEATAISKERKEKVAAKERKETPGDYPPGFEELWKMYPHWGSRGSKSLSFKKWNSWSSEDKVKIIDMVKEKRISCDCGLEDKKYSKAFEGFLENKKGVEFDLESFIMELMSRDGDIKKIGISLAKEYRGESVVRGFIKKYLMAHDSMTLVLH